MSLIPLKVLEETRLQLSTEQIYLDILIEMGAIFSNNSVLSKNRGYVHVISVDIQKTRLLFATLEDSVQE